MPAGSVTYQYKIRDNYGDIGDISGTVTAVSEKAAMAKLYEKHLMLGKTLELVPKSYTLAH